jgi:hypothetical protein
MILNLDGLDFGPMPKAATSAARSNIAAVIRATAEELLDLEIEHYRVAGHLFPKMKDLEGQLKGLATDAGHSFKEFFEGKGDVSGRGRKERESKGKIPEVDPAVFNALPKAEQKDLVRRGIVKLKPSWGRADYGEVLIEPLSFARGHHRRAAA